MCDDTGAGGRPARRRRCPTCNAARTDSAVCHRCKSDLSLLIKVERRADALRRRARACYARGWYRQAATVAGELLSLEASSENAELLACAQLLAGDFPAAVKTHRRLARGGG